MDDDIKESKITFINHMFKFDDETKNELSNFIQYSILAIIPIVTLNKLMKKYIPDADDDKGSIEITFEVLLQIILLVIGIYYIHRLLTYIPTYSGSDYPDLNPTSFMLIFLIIILSLQSKLGDKINILVNRLSDLWNGETTVKSKKPKTVKEVNDEKMKQQQEEHIMQMQLNSQAVHPQDSAQPRQQLPDYNVMYSNPLQDNQDNLMAANEVMGGGFGTQF
tara:strand:- start:2500 stop:3162 length:663 start_codon:yes stop_codon:yes gene_type:complete